MRVGILGVSSDLSQVLADFARDQIMDYLNFTKA